MKAYVEDQICALATPNGVGALSVIRVSGKDSDRLFKKIFNLAEVKPRYTYFKKVYKGDVFLDEVITYLFLDEKSFTGETSFEIISHGSPLIVNDILTLLYSEGVRAAEPGEFSYRSYLNGKIDLTKAEGIHHSIHSKNNLAKTLSLNLLSGGFKNSIDSIKQSLVTAASRLEAVIDFSDQDIDLDQDELIKSELNKATLSLKTLLSSFKVGRVNATGIKVALCGPPNAGKSSLFNKFLNYERSIVSEEAGTTRDYISATVDVNGNPFELIDTAGLRASEDGVEAEGIKRSLDLAKRSQLVLFLISEDTKSEALDYIEKLSAKDFPPFLIVKTKSDLGDWFFDHAKPTPQTSFSINKEETLYELKKQIFESLKVYFDTQNALFLDRHKSLLEAAFFDAEKAMGFKSINGHEDLIVSLVYSSISFIDQVLFVDDPEAVRDKIFKDFCLGK